MLLPWHGLLVRIRGLRPFRGLRPLYTLSELFSNFFLLLSMAYTYLPPSFTTNMRQANLFPNTQKQFDSDRMLLRSDVTITHDRVIIKHKWSKAQQQVSSLRYQHIPKAADSSVCLWSFLSRLFNIYPHVHQLQPLFHFDDFSPITSQFVNRIWKDAVLATGIDPTTTLHSLRRGGALYLQQQGVPLPDVGNHGGWRSNAVLRYTQHPDATSTFAALQALK